MYLSNINKTDNCWNRFGIKYAVWDVFMYFCFLSLFLMQPSTESPWITKLATTEKLNPRNRHEKKIWTHEIPTRKSFGQTKYRREKTSVTRIPTRVHPRRHDDTMALDPQDPQWHVPTKFSTPLSQHNFSTCFSPSQHSDIQKQSPKVFCKKGVLRNFVKFTGKHLYQSLFFN